jgi:hypothetical protein
MMNFLRVGDCQKLEKSFAFGKNPRGTVIFGGKKRAKKKFWGPLDPSTPGTASYGGFLGCSVGFL